MFLLLLWGVVQQKVTSQKVQSQEMLIGAKADQAAQDAQAAKAAADAATVKAEAAAARAENAVKMAEEREKIAEEKAKIAEEKAKIAEEKAKKADERFPEINEEVSQFYGELLTLPLVLREGSGRVLRPCHFLILPPFKSVWTIQAFNLSNHGIF